MIRALAQGHPSLLGSTWMERAMVLSWLDFFWSALELPVFANEESVECAMEKIKVHLMDRSFMVGACITLADLSLWCVVQQDGVSFGDLSEMQEWKQRVQQELDRTS